MHELCTPILYIVCISLISHQHFGVRNPSGLIWFYHTCIMICVLADIHFIYYYIFQTWFLNLYFNEHQNKLKMGNCTLLYIKVTDEHLVSYMGGTRSYMRSLKIKYQTPKNQISHHKQNNIKIEQSMFALAPPPPPPYIYDQSSMWL